MEEVNKHGIEGDIEVVEKKEDNRVDLRIIAYDNVINNDVSAISHSITHSDCLRQEDKGVQ